MFLERYRCPGQRLVPSRRELLQSSANGFGLVALSALFADRAFADIPAPAAHFRARAKNVIFCNSVWSSEAWLGFGVEEFPDVEAAQQHANDLVKLNWFQYVEAISALGTKTAG